MFDAETLLAKVIVGLHGEQEFEKLFKKSGFNMGISMSQDRQLQELNRQIYRLAKAYDLQTTTICLFLTLFKKNIRAILAPKMCEPGGEFEFEIPEVAPNIKGKDTLKID